MPLLNEMIRSASDPKCERLGLNLAFAILCLLCLWSLAQPNGTLVHDSVLYLAQALRAIDPQPLASDVFFAHGSQERHSLYPALMAWLYLTFDPQRVQLAVLWVSQVSFFWAIWLMTGHFDRHQRWAILLALVCGTHRYGGLYVFSFLEPFLTARTLAEPLCVLALVLALRGSIATSLLLVTGAAFIHPLVAFPVALIVWLMGLQLDRRWIWLLLTTPLTLSAGFVGVEPFSRLFETFDAAWWLRVCDHCQILEWETEDIELVVFDLLVLALALRFFRDSAAVNRIEPSCDHDNDPHRGSDFHRTWSSWVRMINAVLVAAAGLLLISLVAGDFFQNVLLTQLQLWRVLWVLRLLSIVLAAAMLIVLIRRAGNPWELLRPDQLGKSADHPHPQYPQRWTALHAALALILVQCAVAVNWPSIMPFVAWLLVWMVGVPFLISKQAVLPRRWGLAGVVDRPFSSHELLGCSFWMALAVSTMFVILSIIGQLDWQASGIRPTGLEFWVRSIAHSFIAAVCVFVLFLWFDSWSKPVRLSALAISAAAVVMVLSQIRVDNPVLSAVRDWPNRPHPFDRWIGAGDQVYWDRGQHLTWVFLRRPNFISDQQSAGLIFTRAGAAEYSRRLPRFEDLEWQRQACGPSGIGGSNRSSKAADVSPLASQAKGSFSSTCLPDVRTLSAICGLKDGPGFLIFPFRMSESAVAEWRFSRPAHTTFFTERPAEEHVFHLHACSRILSLADVGRAP